MKLLKKILIILLCMAVLLIAVFLIGRYGWKLAGFSVCESAGIEQVNAEEDHVRITEVIYEGEYASYDIDEPMLFIQKNEDGTYRIQIGIYRLIQLDKCVGVDKGDRLEFSTVELGENQEITGTIMLAGEVATVTLYAPWSDTWFKDVNEYNYYRFNKEIVQ